MSPRGLKNIIIDGSAACFNYLIRAGGGHLTRYYDEFLGKYDGRLGRRRLRRLVGRDVVFDAALINLVAFLEGLGDLDRRAQRQ